LSENSYDGRVYIYNYALYIYTLFLLNKSFNLELSIFNINFNIMESNNFYDNNDHKCFLLVVSWVLYKIKNNFADNNINDIKKKIINCFSKFNDDYIKIYIKKQLDFI